MPPGSPPGGTLVPDRQVPGEELAPVHSGREGLEVASANGVKVRRVLLSPPSWCGCCADLVRRKRFLICWTIRRAAGRLALLYTKYTEVH